MDGMQKSRSSIVFVRGAPNWLLANTLSRRMCVGSPRAGFAA
jgi:hypothetical protein